MKIYPALLSDSRTELQFQIDRIKEIEGISTVQIDILDGKFADNLTVTPADLPDLDWGELSLDIHLMTEEPLDYVYELADHKDELNIRAVIGQIERMSNQAHFLEEIEKHEWLPGISVDIYTPFESIESDVLRFIKVIQVMGIEAGFQGQTFKPQALEKLREIAFPCKTLGIELIVDGGVNLETLPAIAEAGATGAAVGSSLWKSASISETIKQLQAVGSSNE